MEKKLYFETSKILLYIFLIIANSNCSFLFAQNNVHSINNKIDTVYSPTNFTTYQLKDRFSDPFSFFFQIMLTI